MSRVYRGHRDRDGNVEVTVNGIQLTHHRSLALRSHSPGGFEWGYFGSGPMQLALALVLDATNDATLAQKHYPRFRDEFVARWDEPTWTVSSDEIVQWLSDIHFPAQV